MNTKVTIEVEAKDFLWAVQLASQMQVMKMIIEVDFKNC